LEVESSAIDALLVPIEIDDQLAHLEHPLLLGSPRPPAEHRPNSCIEMIDRGRLDHIIIGAGIEQFDDLGLIVSCGCNYHGHVAHRSDHLEDVGTVDVGKAEIQNHNVERAGKSGLYPMHCQICRLDLVSSLGQPGG
jgi:hypothetical protein